MIPVRIDSQERANNLSHVIKFILSNFQTSIYVYEDDSISKVPSQLDKTIFDQCHYRFVKNDQSKLGFNKARLLNSMAVECQSKIIASLDSDCFIEDLSFYEKSIESIRNGEFDVVHPHSQCVRYDVSSVKFFVDGNIKFLRRTGMTANNSGGFLFISFESLLKMGMWNENFNSWGGEDTEFYCRAERFGLNKNRLNGTLIHLNHPKNKGSGFYAKPREENIPKLQRSRTLTPNDLKKEVEGWPWVIEAKKEVYGF